MEKDNTAILWLENTRPTVLLYQAPEYDSKMNSVAKQHQNKIDMKTMISFESLEKGLMRNSGSSMRPGKFKTALFSMERNGIVKSKVATLFSFFIQVERAILYWLVAIRPLTPMVLFSILLLT